MWSLTCRYLRWYLIRFFCRRLFLKYSQRGVCTEWADPIETFKEARVPICWGRFVSYVVWLKQFPTAADWYFRIEEQFALQVPSFLELMSHWIQ